MCYNKNVSIGTYILGLVGCYNLYVNYDYKIEAIFFAFVIQMQLIEYFLWENQTCNDVNKTTTKIGTIINHSEPIVLWIAILLLSSKQLPLFINILMTIFVVVTIFYTKYVLSDKNECSLVTPESKPHIKWPWNTKNYGKIYYVFFILCMDLLFINSVDHGYHVATLATGSFLLSSLIYYDKKTVGSMWCFATAFSPWVIPYIYQIEFNL